MVTDSAQRPGRRVTHIEILIVERRNQGFARPRISELLQRSGCRQLDGLVSVSECHRQRLHSARVSYVPEQIGDIQPD